MHVLVRAIPVAVCGLLVLPASPVAASTASTADCAGTNRVTFSPPLTTVARTGTFAVTWMMDCVDSIGGVSVSTGSASYGYSGSCAVAQISNGATVVGGTHYVSANKTGTLVPDSGNPCNFATGVFVGDEVRSP